MEPITAALAAEMAKPGSSPRVVLEATHGWAADALVSILNPMQERRKKYEDNPRLAWDILEAGSSRASKVAGSTMDEVREAMGMSLDYEEKHG